MVKHRAMDGVTLETGGVKQGQMQQRSQSQKRRRKKDKILKEPATTEVVLDVVRRAQLPISERLLDDTASPSGLAVK